ncbi:MAG TPA: cytidylate kinase family protein [Chloroflexia bacterium]|nr:cytidylate kinase family protein [Chloroflexia bacterium]
MSVARTVVTISHEMGSGGHAIAQDLARNLRYAYVDSQIVRMATRYLGIPEEELINLDEKVLPQFDDLETIVTQVPDVALSSVLVPDRDSYGIARQPVLSVPARPVIHSEKEKQDVILGGYHKLMERLIKQAAEKGHAVIVGRGANFILKNRPNVINVLIHSSFEDRVTRLALVEKLDRATAVASIKEKDEQYSQYINTYYNADWTNPDNYHLIINTTQMPLGLATAAITHFVKEFGKPHPVNPQEIDRSYDRLASQDSYTLKEASDLLWISTDVLRQAIYRGELKGELVEHSITRISREALTEWLRKYNHL